MMIIIIIVIILIILYLPQLSSLFYNLGVLFGWDKIKAALLRYEELNGDFFVPWKFTIPSHAENSGWPPGTYRTYGCVYGLYVRVY